LVFTATINANEAGRAAILEKLYFAPKVGDSRAVSTAAFYNLNGVFDSKGNFAKASGVFGSKYIAEDAVVYAPPSTTDPALGHDPETSVYSMTIHGVITGTDGEVVGKGWRVYAYSLDNLYRFKHTLRYPQGGTLADRTLYSTKAEHDPNCNVTVGAAEKCAVQAILAPTVEETGVCFGSGTVQNDADDNETGEFTLYAYGEFQGTTPGFKTGEAIFLIVEEPLGTASPKKYLVTNNCANDSNFYIAFEKDGIKIHNIDLRKYEAKTLYKGWNFVSSSTLKRYVVSNGISTPYEGGVLRDENNAPLSASVCPVITVPSIENVIPSLNKQWGRIYFYDATKPASDAIRQTVRGTTGGKEIEYFSIGYGYWIYVPYVENAQMVMLGDAVNENSPQYHLTLTNPGWNMVGYWGGNAYYTDLPEGMSDLFASSTANFVQISTMDAVFNPFKAGVDRIKASYKKGTQCWYNPSSTDPDAAILRSLSDLTCVGPGFGYFIRVTNGCNVTWPLLTNY